MWTPGSEVALLAEGVDRNMDDNVPEERELASPSSRRAWIEINPQPVSDAEVQQVALLAEGVDRNLPDCLPGAMLPGVALLAEGVDRNCKAARLDGGAVGRPPRGGRG